MDAEVRSRAWIMVAALAGVATAGCEPTAEEPCDPACAPGLACQGGQCGAADGGPGGGGGGGDPGAGGGAGGGGDPGAGGGPAAGDPLSRDSFLFVRAAQTLEVWTYDTAARREQRLFALGAHESLVSIALSPDRRQLAFASDRELDLTRFPPANGLPTESIWLVDQRGVRRVMEPMAGPSTSACDDDRQCDPQGLVCNTALRRCQRRNESRHVGELAFSPDGRTIWFGYSHHWLERDGRVGGGSTIGRIGVDGDGWALYEGLIGDTGCAQITDVAPHPDGRSLAAILTVCGHDGGFYAYDVPPRGAGRVLFQDGTRANQITIGSDFVAPAWSADGRVLYVAVHGNWANPGGLEERDFRSGVFAADTRSGQAGMVFDLPPGQQIRSMALDPSGERAALCIQSGAGTDVWLFESGDRGGLTQLTRDGRSCEVTW